MKLIIGLFKTKRPHLLKEEVGEGLVRRCVAEELVKRFVAREVEELPEFIGLDEFLARERRLYHTL